MDGASAPAKGAARVDTASMRYQVRSRMPLGTSPTLSSTATGVSRSGARDEILRCRGTGEDECDLRMSVRNVPANRIDDRIEGLIGEFLGTSSTSQFAPSAATSGTGSSQDLDKLDAIKHAAAECAKHTRGDAASKP
jgi:hypothetical protein